MLRILVLFIGLHVWRCYALPSSGNSTSGFGDSEQFGFCLPEDNFFEADTSTYWSIFDQLATHEIWDVLNFMVDEMGFYHVRNETFTPEAQPSLEGPNYVYRIDLIDPTKTEAITFLDNNGPRPPRFAKVTVIRLENKPKDVMEYKVGPLPLAPPSFDGASFTPDVNNLSPRPGVIVEKLVKDGEIPFTKRPSELYGTTWVESVIAPLMYSLKDVLLMTVGQCYGYDSSSPDLLEQTREECGSERIKYTLSPALSKTGELRRLSYVHFFLAPERANGDETYLHPIPLSFKLDETDEDIRNWRAFDFEFCHQGPFSSAEELLRAFNGRRLRRCPAFEWMTKRYDRKWAKTDAQRNPRQGSEHPGPRVFEPSSSRFQVSSARLGGGVHFEYSGWEGHFGIRDLTGITFHDVRFRGERIVYELSLQEQYVAYGGYGGSGQTAYFDSSVGLGISTFPLRRGVDCPETALYFPSTKMVSTANQRIAIEADTVCIFEEDAQTTEWRHTHLQGENKRPHLDGVRRSALVVRTVVTAANYDYIYDIRFNPDASIHVGVQMAGYILSSYHGLNQQTREDKPFGTRIQKHTFGLLHDHLSGWKVDMDILGTRNTIRKQEVKVGSWEEALKSIEPKPPNPGWHGDEYVKYIETSMMEYEFGHKIAHPGNTIWSFINENNVNRWGDPRGYTISHGMTSSQLLPDSHPLTKSMAWTKYHLAVTRQKDSEPFSHAAHYDASVLHQAHVSLDDFLDGERIISEDLVGWVMIGLQHLPRTEDLPVISNFGTSFYIKPYNYFEELVSMDFSNTNNFKTCAPITGDLFPYTWFWDPVL